MASDDEQDGLEDLVDQIKEEAEADGAPTIGGLLEASGSRSMGPVLFVPALIAFSPIGAIPGMSIAMGAIIILFAIQLVLGRDHLWTPGFIANRELPADKVQAGTDKMDAIAKRIDKWIGHRWEWATQDAGAIVVGVVAVLLGASMFPLALLPFAVFAPSGALLLLSAGLMTQDGRLIVAGGLIAVVTAALVVYWATGGAQ